MVVIDELHLCIHYGRSFRDEFRELKSLVFSPLPSSSLCLLLTATCSLSIIHASQKLLGIEITHRHWPTAAEMVNRSQSIVTTYTSVKLRFVQKLISEYFGKVNSDSNGRILPNKIMIYNNSRSKIKDFNEKIELYLDSNDNLSKYDVLCVHGARKVQLHKIFL